LGEIFFAAPESGAGDGRGIVVSARKADVIIAATIKTQILDVITVTRMTERFTTMPRQIVPQLAPAA